MLTEFALPLCITPKEAALVYLQENYETDILVALLFNRCKCAEFQTRPLSSFEIIHT